MAIDRSRVFAVPAAAALLLWPALWNGYPIVFADTGTYLSQAIQHYAGWDRPVFYSLFMLPLHLTVTVWPVIVVQAVLAAWVLWRVVQILVPDVSGTAFVVGAGVMSVCTVLPWLASTLMPDLFTPLLVLVLCLLGWVPERLSPWEQIGLMGLAAFLIATQQSSVPLACVLGAALGIGRQIAEASRMGTTETRDLGGAEPSIAGSFGDETPVTQDVRSVGVDGWQRLPVAKTAVVGRFRRWLLIMTPPALAVLALCTVNLAAHGRFAISPFGNVFLLARVVYDGPGMAVLHRDCPAAGWRLCPFVDHFPPTSDDFLWTADSPLYRAGGPKAVSQDAGAIIAAGLRADPAGEVWAGLRNTLAQLTRFASGDGLNPWPTEVSPWIKRDFPAREQAAYAAARQQTGTLLVPPLLATIHEVAALGGVVGCALLLPIAFRRQAVCCGFLLAVLLMLPVSAAITGGLSAPHDRYQARIMWLAPFVAIVSLGALRRRTVCGVVRFGRG